MPSHAILDAHIHLWPSTATSATDHTWMTPSHPLAKRYGISDYMAAAVPAPAGFIYVETDRALPGSSPHVTSTASEDEARSALESWAAAPLDEIRFLRRVAEESPHAGDGFEAGDGKRMKGVVLWAPFHVPAALFQTYLRLAEDVAGPALWARVVGFRFLLQGKREGEVGALVQSVAWVENVAALGKGRDGKGWVFDVGVDTHRDGVEALELVAGMVDAVRKQEKKHANTEPVRFVISTPSSPFPSTHLQSKPNQNP
jgi:L-rhamnono-1,4-lactonase